VRGCGSAGEGYKGDGGLIQRPAATVCEILVSPGWRAHDSFRRRVECGAHSRRVLV